jgi:hypothetical protein
MRFRIRRKSDGVFLSDDLTFKSVQEIMGCSNFNYSKRDIVYYTTSCEINEVISFDDETELVRVL